VHSGCQLAESEAKALGKTLVAHGRVKKQQQQHLNDAQS